MGLTFTDASWGDYQFLHHLLEERIKEPNINISHKEMPGWKQHIQFCASNPYKLWYVIRYDDIQVGTVYLTKNNEIGVHLLKAYRDKHLGQQAVEFLEGKVPSGTKILANINPHNEKSLHFFERNGYTILQVTYQKETL